MADEFADLAITTLAAAIGTADTSITVVDGSRFKTPTVGYEVMIAENEDDPATVKRETVRVTAKVGNTFTVTRNAWGEGAQSFSAGASFEQRLLASSVAKYEATADLAGTVPIGGEVTGGTVGSVLFVGTGGVLDEDSGIVYDAASGTLEIGQAAAGGERLNIGGAIQGSPGFVVGINTDGSLSAFQTFNSGAIRVAIGNNFSLLNGAFISGRHDGNVGAAGNFRIDGQDGDAYFLGTMVIGETSGNYRLDVNGAIGWKPGATVTPADNGHVIVEATNNTTLTLKLKGSDAVVRSVALTLA